MKTVTLYRPVNIEKALDDFDRYVGSFFGESLLAPAARLCAGGPAVDIRETDGAYLLEAELPGYDETDLEIQLDNRTLIIKSAKEDTVEKPEDRYYIRERRKSAFSRSFKLPEDAEAETITANFKNGLLCMEIKKREEAQKRLISIGK
jgi:HSP20 family protein